MLRGQVVADDLEILRRESTPLYFRHLVEVRIEGPLADLVADDRAVLPGDSVAKINVGPGSADAAITPLLGELSIGGVLPGGRRAVESPRVFLPQHVDALREELIVAAVFVAQGRPTSWIM